MIDEKVIAMHQWIVDESERQPAWWAEQAAWAFGAVGLVTDALTWTSGWHFVAAALNLSAATLCIFASRTPVFFERISVNGGPARAIFWAIFAMRLGFLIVEPDASRTARVLHEACGLSFLYFASCKPPRPRKRRQVVVKSAA